MMPPISETRLKLDRLSKRIAKLVAEREALTRQLAHEEVVLANAARALISED